jgi:hypothetical protein
MVVSHHLKGEHTMTDTTKADKVRTPSHAAYHVREFGKPTDGKKAIWTRIGSAWQHADGSGFNLHIDCIPLDGRISLRVVSERTE